MHIFGLGFHDCFTHVDSPIPNFELQGMLMKKMRAPTGTEEC